MEQRESLSLTMAMVQDEWDCLDRETSYLKFKEAQRKYQKQL